MNSSSTPTNNKKLRFKQLQDWETEIEWVELSKILSLYYMQAKIGRLLVPIETMLRVHFLRLRYDMSASGAEEALFQIKVLRDFAKIDMFTDVIPDSSSIKQFQQLIKDQGLDKTIEEAFKLVPMVEERCL